MRNVNTLKASKETRYLSLQPYEHTCTCTHTAPKFQEMHKGLTSLLDTYRHDSDLYELSKLSLVSNTAYKMKAKNTIALSDECQNACSPHYFPCANPQQWQQPGMSGCTVLWHCSIFNAPSHESKRLLYHIC